MSKIRITYIEMSTANKAEKTFDNVNAAAEWLGRNGVMLIDAKEIQ